MVKRRGGLREIAILGLASLLPQVGGSAGNAAPDIPRLDRIGVIVADMDRTIDFMVSALGMRAHPLEFGLESDAKHTGGLKLRYVEGNGIWFVLIQPTSAGPAADYLASRGDGAMVELDFEVDHLDAKVRAIEASGVNVVSWDGKPFEGEEKAWTVQPYGVRLVYLDSKGSKGIPIEIYERGPPATDLIGKRDAMFLSAPDADRSAPRLSHVTVLVRDLEATARFFSHTLALHPRSANGAAAMSNGARCQMIDANGALLELVQPAPDSPEMKLLESQGDGFLAELVYSVPSLERARAVLPSGTGGPGATVPETRVFGCAANLGSVPPWPVSPVASRGVRVILIERP